MRSAMVGLLLVFAVLVMGPQVRADETPDPPPVVTRAEFDSVLKRLDAIEATIGVQPASFETVAYTEPAAPAASCPIGSSCAAASGGAVYATEFVVEQRGWFRGKEKKGKRRAGRCGAGGCG